jgi:hypothetical protein
MQQDPALLGLLCQLKLDSQAASLPVETVRDLQQLFVVFDNDSLVDYLHLPREKVDAISNYFRRENEINRDTYDLDKLVATASLDPHVIRTWNKRQLHSFAVSEFDDDMTKMFPSASSVEELKHSCLAWAQKRFDDEYPQPE